MASHMFETYTRTFARFGLLSLIEEQAQVHVAQSSVTFRNTDVSKRATLVRSGTSHLDTRDAPAAPAMANSFGIALAHHRLKYAMRA